MRAWSPSLRSGRHSLERLPPATCAASRSAPTTASTGSSIGLSPGSSPSRASTRRGGAAGPAASNPPVNATPTGGVDVHDAAAGRWPAATARAPRSRRSPGPAGRPPRRPRARAGPASAISAGEALAAQRTNASKSGLRVAAKHPIGERGARAPAVVRPTHRAERRPPDARSHSPRPPSATRSRRSGGACPFGPGRPRCCRCPRSRRCPGRCSNAPASAISMSVVTTTRAARFSPRSAFAQLVALRIPACTGRADDEDVARQAAEMRQRAPHDLRDHAGGGQRPARPHGGARTVGAREDPATLADPDRRLASADIGADQRLGISSPRSRAKARNS